MESGRLADLTHFLCGVTWTHDFYSSEGVQEYSCVNALVRASDLKVESRIFSQEIKWK